MAEKKSKSAQDIAEQSADPDVIAANKEAEARRKKMAQMQVPSAPPAAAGPGLWDALMNFAIKLRKKQLPQAAGEK